MTVVLCNMLYCEQRPAANVRGGRDEKRLTLLTPLSPCGEPHDENEVEEVHRDAGDLRAKISIQSVSVLRLRRLLTKANRGRDRRWQPHSIVKYCEDEVAGFNR